MAYISTLRWLPGLHHVFRAEVPVAGNLTRRMPHMRHSAMTNRALIETAQALGVPGTLPR
jgi:hypothetical protein